MAEQKQDDQREHTYSSSGRIRDVALKTCWRRWTIGRSGEERVRDIRASGTTWWWWWMMIISWIMNSYMGHMYIETPNIFRIPLCFLTDKLCNYFRKIGNCTISQSVKVTIGKKSGTYSMILVYILIHKQTVSLYQNSTVWLDTWVSRSWDRNSDDSYANRRFHSYQETSVSEGILNAYVSIYMYESKVGDLSRGLTEGSLFNSYYTEV